MFPRPTKRHTTGSWTRLFGLFAAVWVGLALQPCAVAAVSEHDCPHCPPQAEEAARPHQSHCNPDAKVTPDEPPNCDALQANCCDLEQSAANVRFDTTDGDDETVALPASEPAAYPDPGLGADPGSEARPPEPAGGSVPLHVLKCVYLD